VKQINSRDNPFFKHLLKLAQSSRDRRKSEQTLLDGVHLIAAYRDAVGMPEAVAVSPDGLRNPEINALLETLALDRPRILANGLFNQIAPVKHPTGVVALVQTPRTTPPQRLDSCLMLEDIQDPGNLGSILRSAAAAGIAHALLSPGCAFAWAPRVIRAGMGAHFYLGVHEHQDLVAAARRFSGAVVALCPQAPKTLYETDLTGRVALLIGNEGAGLSQELLAIATERAMIPMERAGESLNASAAAAICLFERVRQIRAIKTSKE
jgi:TrmH family RNA methyltransferase